MATNRREVQLDAPAAQVWDAVRDFSRVHVRVAPGFLIKNEMDQGDRVLTFYNGVVARERLVTSDDERMRLAYTAVGGRTTHHNGVIEILPDGAAKCRLVWTIDLLPNELAAAIGGMMDYAMPLIGKTLESRRA
ncbi:MAG TPA: SRPBCC family protein [Reyranella sp.]|jgi:carbon monoxide dehydrogenase subunit G|nr:SRPBCC family protein [Reyranella sp.]